MKYRVRIEVTVWLQGECQGTHYVETGGSVYPERHPPLDEYLWRRGAKDSCEFWLKEGQKYGHKMAQLLSIEKRQGMRE